MDENVIAELSNLGITLSNAMKTFSDGCTLFKGLYKVEYEGERIGSLRQSGDTFTYIDRTLYKVWEKKYKVMDNISFDVLVDILKNIIKDNFKKLEMPLEETEKGQLSFQFD